MRAPSGLPAGHWSWGGIVRDANDSRSSRVHCVDLRIAIASRCECKPRVVRRPRGIIIISRSQGDAPNVRSVCIHHINLVFTIQRRSRTAWLIASRTKRDLCSVPRPSGKRIFSLRRGGQFHDVRSIHAHRVDSSAPIARRMENDTRTIPRKRWTTVEWAVGRYPNGARSIGIHQISLIRAISI